MLAIARRNPQTEIGCETPKQCRENAGIRGAGKRERGTKRESRRRRIGGDLRAEFRDGVH